jgi:hypothetical protein
MRAAHPKPRRGIATSAAARDWGLEEFSNGEVARYGRRGSDDGKIWISGSHLIMVERQIEEHRLWVETFTELYLAKYPPY